MNDTYTEDWARVIMRVRSLEYEEKFKWWNFWDWEPLKVETKWERN
jgi:hypothetical protein